MMKRLSIDGGPDIDRPECLIDDPRWVAIRQQAKVTLDALSSGDVESVDPQLVRSH